MPMVLPVAHVATLQHFIDPSSPMPPHRIHPPDEDNIPTAFDETDVIEKARREVGAKGRGTQIARLLVVLVSLALVSSNAWLLGEARSDAITRALESNTNLSRAVAERVDAMASQANHVLDGILFELERNYISTDALERLQPVLVNHVAALDHLQGLFVYDAQGRWIATSEPTWNPANNNADRPYFIHHRQNPSGKLLIGVPIVSRSSGRWVVPLSRRMNDANGQFAGVVLATFSVEKLVASLDRFTIGPDGAITLFADGHILARRPFREADLGQRLPPSAAAAQIGDRPSGVIDAPSPLDGVPRLVSFERGRDHGILVTVATSKNTVLKPWRRASYVQTGWAVFLCLVLMLAGSSAKKSMDRRLEAQAHLLELSEALNRANAKFARLARHDSLTGLGNRRDFDQRFDRAFKLAQRSGQPIAVVMVDVDQFKLYNDSYGHGQGDQCLKQVAAALARAVNRPDDVVARYGGEEMVMLLPFTDAAGAARVAEAARTAVLDLQIEHTASAHGVVSVSLGVAAMVPTAASSAQGLLREADLALYRAKSHGRNQVWTATA
jgi:diguanylate cyclase (GGDEF)-like protein